MAQFITAAEAVQKIENGATLATSGFVGGIIPEAVLKAIQASYMETGTPRDLNVVFAAGQGDGGERGLNHLGEEGLLRCIVGGHFNLTPRIGKLVMDNKVAAYNSRRARFPSGFGILPASGRGRLPKSACAPSSILA